MAEDVEDERDLSGKEGAAFAGKELTQAGIVVHVEAQLCPCCARTDGREIELGQLRTTVGLWGHLKFEIRVSNLMYPLCNK